MYQCHPYRFLHTHCNVDQKATIISHKTWNAHNYMGLTRPSRSQHELSNNYFEDFFFFKSFVLFLVSPSSPGISIKIFSTTFEVNHFDNWFFSPKNFFIWHYYHLVAILYFFYRVLLSKDDFPGGSISFIFPQLNIERKPRDISLGPPPQKQQEL